MQTGKVAICETVLSDNTVITAIEVVIGRRQISISNQFGPLPDDIAQLAQQLLEKVRQTNGSNDQD